MHDDLKNSPPHIDGRARHACVSDLDQYIILGEARCESTFTFFVDVNAGGKSKSESEICESSFQRGQHEGMNEGIEIHFQTDADVSKRM